jgi:hypothetical protein
MDIQELANESYRKNLTPDCDEYTLNFIEEALKKGDRDEAERLFSEYLKAVFTDGYTNGFDGCWDKLESGELTPADCWLCDDEVGEPVCAECQQETLAELQATVQALSIRVAMIENAAAGMVKAMKANP